MANLNIPFVLLQPSQCSFKPTIATSKLISYQKYNLKSQTKVNDSESTFRGREERKADDKQNDTFEGPQAQQFCDLTPKNLVVLGDSETGTLVLCHQEWFVSKKREGAADSKTKRINKFVITLQPRVLLIPSISEEVGPVRDHCLVRSPAQHVLSTSSYFLVTLHNDNRVRLWNTNDGRCVMTSQQNMLVTVCKKLRKIKNHPGHIVAIGDKGDIYIINVYTMNLLNHFAEDFSGVQLTLYKSKQFVLCDNSGKMYIWRDDSGPSPLRDVAQAVKSNSLLLDLCSSAEYERFKFSITHRISGLGQAEKSVLAIHFTSSDQIIQAHNGGIDYILNQQRLAIHELSGPQSLVFAKFFTIEKRKLLLCVNTKYQIVIYDTLKLKNESTSKEPIFKGGLFDDCSMFESCEIKSDDTFSMLRDKMLGDQSEAKSFQLNHVKAKIDGLLQTDKVAFKFNSSQKLLFTIINLGKHPQMVTWCLEAIIENLQFSLDYSNAKIPLFLNKIKLFPTLKRNCLMHFQPILSKNYYNKHQFQFFFASEIITESVIYTSIDHPSLIFGTNFGRIFLAPLFQEHEQKVLPLVLLDSHQQSPITQLFIAYNSSRKLTYAASSNLRASGSFPQHQQQAIDYERGGHLVSVSMNGTIAVTVLNSGEIEKQLHATTPMADKDRRRAQNFMDGQHKNVKLKRRNSIQQDFSVNHYFHLVRAKSHKVYSYSSFDTIAQIIEVKHLSELHEKIIEKHQAPEQRRGHSPESKTPEGERLRERRGSAEGIFANDDAHSLDYPAYACIGKDGMVFLLKISNVHAEIIKLAAVDSKAIGVYQDFDKQQLYVLTEKLSLFIFNNASQTLERRTDFRQAISLLYIKETVDYLMNMDDSFKGLSKNDTSILDYYTFEKVFMKKNLLMGHGSHKVLDFLSLSLNHPLNYHPHSIYSTKYSKIMRDLLLNKVHFHEFEKQEESQKMVLRALNQAYFYNNKLYKSDFNNDYFMKQTGVSTLTTNGTFCGTKQQIILVNTKQMMKIMKQKMKKVTTQLQSSYSRRLSNQLGEDGEDFVNSNEKAAQASPRSSGRQSFRRDNSLRRSGTGRKMDTLASVKWPTRLLSLVHPFNLDEYIDQQLEQQFGLNLPFLDFRIGVQGTEESFSFIISKEDESYHHDRKKVVKILQLLKMSQAMSAEVNKKLGSQLLYRINSSLSANQQQAQELIYTEPIGVFFNSEYWKISSYMSTVIPVFMISTLVSIIEFAQPQQIQFAIEEQLYSLQKINQQKTLDYSNQLSLSVLSKLLLKKDADISSTARDVIMKPIMYTLDRDYLKVLMKEWQDIIMDTYKRLKKESITKKSTSNQQRSEGQGSSNTHLASTSSTTVSGASGSEIRLQHLQAAQSDHKLINYYFGELEIRGLINLSQYSLYHPTSMDKQIQYRVSKLTTILTREIVEKFSGNKKYIYLLTTLLQQLSTWIKVQDRTTKDKAIIQETIKLLLQLFNYYKESLTARFITRTIGENFHLIRPNRSDLYLKLTAAKTLMEIGEYQTHDFLNIIQEQAINLNEGLDYQRNVLEILRFFINSQGETLEHYLIHLTQIFIKCLDPNDLVLRKNSHKLISVILSRMVSIFPMVAFHHESQRLAIGTAEGFIAIYDVRTSAKYKILEKHEGNVTCMAFDSKGNLLSSYSAVDATVKLWKVGNTGFFSTIMGGTSKYSKEVKLQKLDSSLNPHLIIQANKAIALSGNARNDLVIPSQEPSPTHSGARVNKCSVKFKLPKERDVTLVRENGVEEIVKLVK